MADVGRTSHGSWHAYCIRPDIHFETQGKEEEVILVLRRHPFHQLSWVINSLFVLILLIVFNLFFTAPFSIGQIIFINLFFIAFILSYLYFNLLSYLFNVGIVTNKRIVDIDFHGAIYKEITAASLDKVEDVTARAGGYLASLFDYGDVHVQTAGEEANIEFLQVPKPSEALSIINDLTIR